MHKLKHPAEKHMMLYSLELVSIAFNNFCYKNLMADEKQKKKDSKILL